MFHVEQVLCFITAVSLISSPLCAVDFFLQPIAMAQGDNAEAVALSNRSVEKFLFGDTDTAEACATQANKLAGTPISHCVLYLLHPDADRRKALEDDVNKGPLTPQEAFWIRVSLLLGSGHLEPAAREFLSHAEQYRNDAMSAAWGIVMLHYAGREHHQEALETAARWKTLHPDNILIAFARSIIEEGQTDVSDEALAAAQQCVKARRNENRFILLEAYLLMQRKQYEEALAVLSSEDDSSVSALQVGYVKATLLYMMNRQEESLLLRKQMDAAPIFDDARGALQRWEIHTLPLRILITRPEELSIQPIRFAKKAATLTDNTEPLNLYRDCLVAAALARYHAEKGKKSVAIPFLQKAETNLQELLKEQDRVDKADLTYYFRACEACTVALHHIRAMLYPETSETWKQNEQEAHKPAARLLPPILPACSMP